MRAFLIFALFASVGAAVYEEPFPEKQNPFYKMVLTNDYVEVIRLSLPPGQKTMMHTHSHDVTTIFLSESTVSVDAPGRKSARELVHAGDVSAGAYAKQRLTHWVNNIGKTALEVLEIELRNRPGGLKTEPIAEPASESESFRAYRWILAQGVSTPMHTHKRPYLMVAATPMQLTMKAPDESFMEHPIKAGDFHWIDSQVTHILTNNGKESGILIEVELK